MSGPVRYGGALLFKGNLVNECCCKWWCCIVGYDDCGQPIRSCSRTKTDDACTGPFDTAEECYDECPEPPPCCPCGCCEICIDGECYPCPDGYSCVDCECVPPPPPPPPGPYYCCYNYTGPEPGYDDPEGLEAVRRSGTTCHIGPCGRVEDGEFIPEEWRTAGGPYGSLRDCNAACQRHTCLTDDCGYQHCSPDSNGQYTTRDECYDTCVDPAEQPCAISPSSPYTVNGFGAGTWNYYFTIDPAENRPICVAYVSTCGRPIRAQIWAPLLSGTGCEQIADRTIVGDSQWRGTEDCNCDFDPPGGFKGVPKGFVKWRTKQRGVTTFEVQILTECPENEWQITVTCGPCAEMPNYKCCCDCGTLRPEVGCIKFPFGFDDAPLVILNIEWFGLNLPSGDPVFPWFDTAAGPGGRPSWNKSMYRSGAGQGQALMFCEQDVDGVWHLKGYFRTAYIDNPANPADDCNDELLWLYDYELDPINDMGGPAVVTLLGTACANCPAGTCGPADVYIPPVVTITLPP